MFSETIDTAAIEKSLTRERLGRFSLYGRLDAEESLKLYIWNCQLCEAFYLPLHIAEVTTRNAIQQALQVRVKKPWYLAANFISLLDEHYKKQLQETVENELLQHSQALSDNHVVSSLTFGFWEHLTTKRFDRLLWIRGVQHNFPNAYAKI